MKLAQKLAINYVRAKLNILAVISKRKAAKEAFRLFCTPFRKPKTRYPPIFQKAEKLSFVLEGKLVKGYRWNHPSQKKIVIVHGFESYSNNFDRYISILVKKGMEVIAFDAPAHGRSEGKQINLPMYVAMLKKLVEYYGPVDGFLGHSFGGLAISHYLETLKSNEHIRSVLIAPATETKTSIDLMFKFLQLDDEVRKEFDQLIHEKAGVGPEHFSVARAMKNIKGPVLWFHDEEDDLTPIKDALKARDAGFTNLEFIITKGLGHRKIYRDNKVVKRSIEFLKGELPGQWKKVETRNEDD